MENIHAVNQVVNQIKDVSGRISSLTLGISEMKAEKLNDIADSFNEQRSGQLADLQELLLVLTGLIAPEVAEQNETSNTDEGEESAFAEGELTSDVTPKKDCSRKSKK